VPAKTAVVDDRPGLAGPLVTGAPLGWLWHLRRVRWWLALDD
jgi:hypothetical protein